MQNLHLPDANTLVPTVIEQTNRGERAFDLFSRLMTQRIIWLPADVNYASVQILQGSLLHLDSEDAEKPIHFYINSPGGSVYDGNGLLDTIDLVKAPVYTYCAGLAASFGASLLASGEPGYRHVTRRSRVMIHEVRNNGGGGGTVTDLDIRMDEMKLINDLLVEDLYAKLRDDAPNKPGSVEELRDYMSRDRWMSAEEAVAFGLADQVL